MQIDEYNLQVVPPSPETEARLLAEAKVHDTNSFADNSSSACSPASLPQIGKDQPHFISPHVSPIPDGSVGPRCSRISQLTSAGAAPQPLTGTCHRAEIAASSAKCNSWAVVALPSESPNAAQRSAGCSSTEASYACPAEAGDRSDSMPAWLGEPPESPSGGPGATFIAPAEHRVQGKGTSWLKSSDTSRHAPKAHSALLASPRIRAADKEGTVKLKPWSSSSAARGISTAEPFPILAAPSEQRASLSPGADDSPFCSTIHAALCEPSGSVAAKTHVSIAEACDTTKADRVAAQDTSACQTAGKGGIAVQMSWGAATSSLTKEITSVSTVTDSSQATFQPSVHRHDSPSLAGSIKERSSFSNMPGSSTCTPTHSHNSSASGWVSKSVSYGHAGPETGQAASLVRASLESPPHDMHMSAAPQGTPSLPNTFTASCLVPCSMSGGYMQSERDSSASAALLSAEAALCSENGLSLMSTTHPAISSTSTSCIGSASHLYNLRHPSRAQQSRLQSASDSDDMDEVPGMIANSKSAQVKDSGQHHSLEGSSRQSMLTRAEASEVSLASKATTSKGGNVQGGVLFAKENAEQMGCPATTGKRCDAASTISGECTARLSTASSNTGNSLENDVHHEFPKVLDNTAAQLVSQIRHKSLNMLAPTVASSAEGSSGRHGSAAVPIISSSNKQEVHHVGPSMCVEHAEQLDSARASMDVLEWITSPGVVPVLATTAADSAVVTPAKATDRKGYEDKVNVHCRALTSQGLAAAALPPGACTIPSATCPCHAMDAKEQATPHGNGCACLHHMPADLVAGIAAKLPPRVSCSTPPTLPNLLPTLTSVSQLADGSQVVPQGSHPTDVMSPVRVQHALLHASQQLPACIAAQVADAARLRPCTDQALPMAAMASAASAKLAGPAPTAEDYLAPHALKQEASFPRVPASGQGGNVQSLGLALPGLLDAAGVKPAAAQASATADDTQAPASAGKHLLTADIPSSSRAGAKASVATRQSASPESHPVSSTLKEAARVMPAVKCCPTTPLSKSTAMLPTDPLAQLPQTSSVPEPAAAAKPQPSLEARQQVHESVAGSHPTDSSCSSPTSACAPPQQPLLVCTPLPSPFSAQLPEASTGCNSQNTYTPLPTHASSGLLAHAMPTDFATCSSGLLFSMHRTRPGQSLPSKNGRRVLRRGLSIWAPSNQHFLSRFASMQRLRTLSPVPMLHLPTSPGDAHWDDTICVSQMIQRDLGTPSAKDDTTADITAMLHGLRPSTLRLSVATNTPEAAKLSDLETLLQACGQVRSSQLPGLARPSFDWKSTLTFISKQPFR
jgi:hypothetical protein